MSKALFKKGDKVRFILDNIVYNVDTVSPENDNVPGERLYFITFAGRWPFALAKSHTIPESAAAKWLTFVK